MKTKLTIAESLEIITFGIDPELASSYEEVSYEDIPIFNLTDIIGLLPRFVLDDGDTKELKIQAIYNEGWECFYGSDKMWYQKESELIDALYKMLLCYMEMRFCEV